ncbi:uncharacterized protein [Diabrotica undecimpunctata]|uniref:uncharacterized protein n=1 Tax=Diabrotica undecimpunctata TaxID=50387 RepID=UPI003B637842
MYSARQYSLNQGLELTSNKSAVVLFTPHRLPNISSIGIDNLSIPVQKHYTYLGVTLDTKLSWEEHINNCLIKCENSLNVLKVVNRHQWGADPKVNRLKKLDRIQYKALRLVLGALKSTPTKNLLAECMEPPLHLRRLFLAEKFILKCQSNNQSYLLQKISDISVSNLVDKWWHNIKSPTLAIALPNVSSYLEIPAETYFFHSNFNILYSQTKVYFPTFDDNNAIQLHKQLAKFDKPYRILTDGSKSLFGVGCAVYFQDNQEQIMFKLNQQRSIDYAELFAIYQALEWTFEKRMSDQQIIIMSYSKS